LTEKKDADETYTSKGNDDKMTDLSNEKHDEANSDDEVFVPYDF
jgi:hypothetical protein